MDIGKGLFRCPCGHRKRPFPMSTQFYCIFGFFILKAVYIYPWHGTELTRTRLKFSFNNNITMMPGTFLVSDLKHRCSIGSKMQSVWFLNSVFLAVCPFGCMFVRTLVFSDLSVYIIVDSGVGMFFNLVQNSKLGPYKLLLRIESFLIRFS